MAGGKKVLIDTDPGTDDAIALLMALGVSKQVGLDVLGITTVGGNASIAHTTRNTLAVLEYAGRGDVPVAKGASNPLEGTFPYAYYYHGKGGLSVRLPSPQIELSNEGAAEFLRRNLSVRIEDGITVVALGPLTNLAKLLMQHPEVGQNLSGLVVMGGAVAVPGNVTAHAEFNFYSDPLAAKTVLSSGLPVTLVDLAVCRQVSIRRDQVSPLLTGGKAGRLAGRILDHWFKRNPDQETYDLCDPLAMAVAIEPCILTTGQRRVEVETCSAERNGKTTSSDSTRAGPEGPNGNIQVATGVNTQRFFEVFFSTLTRD